MNVSMTPVNSSQIKEIGHQQDTLYIRFKNKKLYSYKPVSADKFQEFKNSDSKGKFFHKEFKMNSKLIIQQENIDIK